MAIGFQREHQLCLIQMGTDSDSGQAGSHEDTNTGGGGDGEIGGSTAREAKGMNKRVREGEGEERMR
ncbi:hypothetical protein NQZ68_036208 [Dissostichus eleginoides]|nr:hypothetical protein NQZ68_036208 [Dissostichus eleginoides]